MLSSKQRELENGRMCIQEPWGTWQRGVAEIWDQDTGDLREIACEPNDHQCWNYSHASSHTRKKFDSNASLGLSCETSACLMPS